MTMRYLLIALVFVGCGESAAAPASFVAGATGGSTAMGGAGGAGSDDGTGGAPATGGMAGAAAGAPGTGGAAGALATALSCLIPETQITTVAPPTSLYVTGGTTPVARCTAYNQTVTPGISQGQVITGAGQFSSGWTVQHYMINPSPTDPTTCAAVISFQCIGCAAGCGDALMEVMLNVAPN